MFRRLFAAYSGIKLSYVYLSTIFVTLLHI